MGMLPPPPTLFISLEEVERKRNKVLKIDSSIQPKITTQETKRHIMTAQEEERLIIDLIMSDHEESAMIKSLEKIRLSNNLSLKQLEPHDAIENMFRYDLNNRPKLIPHEEVEKQLDEALKSLKYEETNWLKKLIDKVNNLFFDKDIKYNETNYLTKCLDGSCFSLSPEDKLAVAKNEFRINKLYVIPGYFILTYAILTSMFFVLSIPASVVAFVVATLFTSVIGYFLFYKPNKKKVRIAEDEYNKIMEPEWDKIIAESDQEQYEESKCQHIAKL